MKKNINFIRKITYSVIIILVSLILLALCFKMGSKFDLQDPLILKFYEFYTSQFHTICITVLLIALTGSLVFLLFLKVFQRIYKNEDDKFDVIKYNESSNVSNRISPPEFSFRSYSSIVIGGLLVIAGLPILLRALFPGISELQEELICFILVIIYLPTIYLIYVLQKKKYYRNPKEFIFMLLERQMLFEKPIVKFFVIPVGSIAVFVYSVYIIRSAGLRSAGLIKGVDTYMTAIMGPLGLITTLTSLLFQPRLIIEEMKENYNSKK